MITKKIFKIISHKTIQIVFIYIFLIAFGSFIGYGDIIQNFGSKHNPPNFWLGGIIKSCGIIGIGFFIFQYSKIYKPYIFKFKKRIK